MDYKLSILIPTKDRLSLLKRALNSVCNQDVLPDEIIVINDSSSDGTKEFLEIFSKSNPNINWVILNKEVNGGVNKARNSGVKLSKADWIIFLDDDDELLPNSLGVVKEKLSSMPNNFNVAYFNSIIDDNKEGTFVGGFQFREDEDFYDPSYEDTVMKFNLKRDCKPVFRKTLFSNEKYLFQKTVNGFESYTMNIISKDNKGIRYFKNQMTLVHFDNSPKHLSISASRKNPLPLLILHIKQIPQHWIIYVKHPVFLCKKVKDMLRLLIRSIF